MARFTRAALLDMSNRVDKETMKRWLKIQLGRKKMTDKDFDQLMREYLPKESYYQSKIMEWIKEEFPQAFVWKAAAGPYSRMGIPDICAIIDGHYYGFEVKRPFIGKLSKIQEEVLKEIRAAGGTAAVVSFPKQCKEIINGNGCIEGNH